MPPALWLRTKDEDEDRMTGRGLAKTCCDDDDEDDVDSTSVKDGEGDPMTTLWSLLTMELLSRLVGGESS